MVRVIAHLCATLLALLCLSSHSLNSPVRVYALLLQHREFFIAGEPIEQMGDAAELATSGEVTFSPAAAQLLLPKLGMDPHAALPNSGRFSSYQNIIGDSANVVTSGAMAVVDGVRRGSVGYASREGSVSSERSSHRADSRGNSAAHQQQQQQAAAVVVAAAALRRRQSSRYGRCSV